MPVRFTIEQVFELRQRGVILAAGHLQDGTVAGTMTLHDETTGQAVRVLGLELIPPPTHDPDRVILIIDPASPLRPVDGMVLVSPT